MGSRLRQQYRRRQERSGAGRVECAITHNGNQPKTFTRRVDTTAGRR